MDHMSVNHVSKPSSKKGTTTKTSNSVLVKNHNKVEMAKGLKYDKPECVFCDFKKSKKSKNSR